MSNEAFDIWLKENYLHTNPPFIEIWQAAKADSEREIAELEKVIEINHALMQADDKEQLKLQAHINDLREDFQKSLVALEKANIEGLITDTIWIGNAETLFDFMGESLSKTPAQSLQEHDNEVIDRCAKVCDGYTHGAWFAEKIRALKS